MKKVKTFKKLAASVLAVAMGASFGACVTEATNSQLSEPTEKTEEVLAGSAYLAIDINPSVEMVVEDGVVTDIYAANDDASVLLSGEELIGLTTGEAAQEIVELAEEMGYLNEENAAVKITVASDDEEYAQDVEEDATEGAESGSDIAEVNNEPRSADDRTCKKLKEKDPQLYKNLTPAKVRLIEAIMQYDESITFEVAVEMDFAELMGLLKQYVAEYGEFADEQLKEEYRTRKQTLKAEQERAIAEVYGEEYLTQWERVQALKKAVDELGRVVEEGVISSAHANALALLLGSSNMADISEDASVTVSKIDEYLDKHFVAADKSGMAKELFHQIKESIHEILENYDKDAYTLSAEDLAAIEAVWGEAVSITTFEELRAFVDEQIAALEEYKKTLQETLSDEQLADIEEIAQSVKDVQKQVREHMKEKIEQKQNEIREEKREKAGDRMGAQGERK